MSEKDLYPGITKWLELYLNDKYKGYEIITTYEGSVQKLDVVLQKYNVDEPMAKGLDIEVDVIGILKKGDEHKLVFVEVKNTYLNLNNLGQLWGYCQLINPEEAFLVSPAGLGSLTKVLFDFNRRDILRYGDG